jgi:hypothetical protein
MEMETEAWMAKHVSGKGTANRVNTEDMGMREDQQTRKKSPKNLPKARLYRNANVRYSTKHRWSSGRL